MAAQQTFEGLNYYQAQKRNSEKFQSLSKEEQKKARKSGYKNRGWNNVRKSWKILQDLSLSSMISFVDFAVQKAENAYQSAKRSGDLLKILEAGSDRIEALKLKYQ